MPELVPVLIGGRVAAYRPAAEESAPTKTSAKSATKKTAAQSASTAEEATK